PAQLSPQPKQCRFGCLREIRRAYRAEKNGVAGKTRRERFGWERISVFLICKRAEVVLDENEFVAEDLRNTLQHAHRLARRLRADPVAGKNCDPELHVRTAWRAMSSRSPSKIFFFRSARAMKRR